MQLIKEIVDAWGYINSNQLTTLAKDTPDLPVVIKWGGMPREQLGAAAAKARIAEVEAKDSDYCREVFIASKTLDEMLGNYLTPNFVKLAIHKLKAK